MNTNEHIRLHEEAALIYKKFAPAKISPSEQRLLFHRTKNRLTQLGQEFITDAEELLYLSDSREVEVSCSLKEAKASIKNVLSRQKYPFGYITGGLEGIHLHRLFDGLVVSGISAMILGLEESDYTNSKGRQPLYTTAEKMALWQKYAPSGSLVFVIPRRPDHISPNDYYDWITQYLGIWKNSKVIFLVRKMIHRR